MDVLSTSPASNTIAWHENLDGQGTFAQPKVIANVTARAIKAVDLDGDGDPDILSASGSELFWLANANGSFSTRRTITALLHGIEALEAGDVDGDGDLDVLSSSYGAGNVDWYENIDGLGRFGDRQSINDSGMGANSVRVADVDTDGDNDVLIAVSVVGFGGVSWFENEDGQGNFLPRNVTHRETMLGDVTVGVSPADVVSAADIDGDGDLDVISSKSGSRANISWYENTDGKGNFGEPQLITTALNGFSSMDVADLDRDGDFDVLSAYGWYKNLSSPVAAGDSNRDFQFDQQDIVLVLKAAKYLTGEPATFEQGDWNEDGVFDQLDIVAALATGNYLQGLFALTAK